MKKLSIFAVAFAAMVFAACGGNKSGNTVETNDSIKSFEQEQIEASIKMHVDSLASEIGKLKQLPVMQASNGNIKLTKEELQVKPTYLLAPAVAENATTLAEKYRMLAALQVDAQTAKLYEMPTDETRLLPNWLPISMTPLSRLSRMMLLSQRLLRLSTMP